ncbi:MAG: asparagine synthase (glutamine-hydrolyzing) [Flavobacteriales bacterium]|nr:asparagine synthase (glutamine-hydrolyzing) [Flavobacteriales bacterium]
MCGINGIYGKADGIRDRIAAMNKALAHRGPDAEGQWEGEGIALGHRRLAVIDLDHRADQPMHSPCGRYTLVYNGEIYNFRELRESLAADATAAEMPFTTDSDTEVLLTGLVLRGPDFLKRCNGMFALAFWDARERRLILARDRLGIKPLYYARAADKMIFSSELRALLRSGLTDRNLDPKSLADYLRYQTVHGERTAVEGVRALPPGTFLLIDDNEEVIKTWWHPLRNVRMLRSNADYAEATESVRTLLEDSVKLRLTTDVPYGAFLSGGIDSSIITAIAARASKSKLRTFTVTFDEAEHSEGAFAKKIADRCGTDHTEIHLPPGSLLDSLPDALAAADHPGGDGINTFVVSQAAKAAGITVVLSGLGGDELFAGYPVFAQIKSLQTRKWLLSYPGFARAAAGTLYKMWKPGIASAKIAQVIGEDYFDTEFAYQYSREVMSLGDVKRTMRNYEGGGNEVFRIAHEGIGYGNEGYALPLLSRVSYAELSTYLPSVLLRDADHMSMAHALEVRVPFLDHRLVETVLGIPDKFKDLTSPKKLLTDAAGDLIPPETASRTKMGFTFPWEQRMRNELREFCDDHMEALALRPQFDTRQVRKRYAAFRKGSKDVTWSRIWYLCALEAWLQRNEVS